MFPSTLLESPSTPLSPFGTSGELRLGTRTKLSFDTEVEKMSLSNGREPRVNRSHRLLCSYWVGLRKRGVPKLQGARRGLCDALVSCLNLDLTVVFLLLLIGGPSSSAGSQVKLNSQLAEIDAHLTCTLTVRL